MRYHGVGLGCQRQRCPRSSAMVRILLSNRASPAAGAVATVLGILPTVGVARCGVAGLPTGSVGRVLVLVRVAVTTVPVPMGVGREVGVATVAGAVLTTVAGGGPETDAPDSAVASSAAVSPLARQRLVVGS